jgi:hypothetical protein
MLSCWFLLLLHHAFSAPFTVVGPVLWTILKDLLMPAAAIFSSGYLAIRLQRRDHDRQMQVQREQHSREVERERRQDQRRLIQNASAQDAQITELAFEMDTVKMRAVSTSLGHNTLDFWLLEDPSRYQLGLWLASKRALAVKYIRENGSSSESGAAMTSFFVETHALMVFWLEGHLEGSWFKQDAARIEREDFTMDNERRIFKEVQTMVKRRRNA